MSGDAQSNRCYCTIGTSVVFGGDFKNGTGYTYLMTLQLVTTP
jgi:hypothetical protein